MTVMQNLQKIVKVDIPFLSPKKLKELSTTMKAGSSFLDIQETFEFPPKDLQTIINLLYSNNYNMLNFFDITRLLTQIEKDSLSSLIDDKKKFVLLFQELYCSRYKYIKRIMTKVVAKLYLTGSTHSLKDSFLEHLNTPEFNFLKLCLYKSYKEIHEITNLSLKKVMKNLNIDKVFFNLEIEYQNYLIDLLSNNSITDETYACYENNLLDYNKVSDVNEQLKKILNYLENSKFRDNNKYLDRIIYKKLGNIEDINSNWFQLVIAEDLMNRYKKLKGIFEFHRFLDIADYLSENSDLKESNLTPDGKTSDATRILNRSAFWSNYDERFSSVEMWVSKKDYQILEKSTINLSKVKLLDDAINNEMCVFYFNNMTIINFFRQDRLSHKYDHSSHKTDRRRFDTLVFIGKTAQIVNQTLKEKNLYSIEINNQLYDMANFLIKFGHYLWQGWVDQFLRSYNIYPNDSILNGKKFLSAKTPVIKEVYHKEKGLEEVRTKALNAEKPSTFNDVIVLLKKVEKFDDSTPKLTQEVSSYSKYINSIQNPSFEKIRRYCNNLVDENQADEMQNDFAEYARMHKALIYDALEQFLERLDGETITLIDWECGQGIGSMLVLDYIREKQLNIKIEKIILVDNDAEYLSRAILHVEGLKQNDIEIVVIDVRNAKDIEKLNKLRNHISLNLFVNDAMPLEYLDIDFDIFENAYFICISNMDEAFVDGIYQGFNDFIEVKKISSGDGKIGKFQRHERIFKIVQ